MFDFMILQRKSYIGMFYLSSPSFQILRQIRGSDVRMQRKSSAQYLQNMPDRLENTCGIGC